MVKSLKNALAFVGVIVGAGFASGQEILQYFTSFGIIDGTLGALLSIIFFAHSGRIILQVGSFLCANSHREVIYEIGGEKIGKFLDVIITFTLFSVGVVMIAGAGANLRQQFGLPIFIGSLILAFLIVVVCMMNTDRVISIIGSITPFLLVFIVLSCLYSINTIDQPLDYLQNVALSKSSNLPHWAISTTNYVSLNLTLGAPMALVIGGAEKDEKIAARGGFLGGLITGLLIFISHLSMFGKINIIGSYDMPLLELITLISPKFGFVMALVLFGMIFNTAVGMFYSFSARLAKQGTKNFKVILCISVFIAYLLSFAGFTDLVSYVYPLIGYFGLFFIFVLVNWWLKESGGKKQKYKNKRIAKKQII